MGWRSKEQQLAYGRKWRAENPDWQKNYRRLNPERFKEYERRRRVGGDEARMLREYGITLAEHRAILAAQEGLCAICGKQDKLHVDHDHATGAVRGLLCGRCNRGLGLFADDVSALEAAIGYLKKRRRPC